MNEEFFTNFIDETLGIVFKEQTTGKIGKELETLHNMSKKEILAKKGDDTGKYLQEQLDVTLNTVENMTRESRELVNTVANIRGFYTKLKDKEQDLIKWDQQLLIKSQKISQFKNNELKEMFNIIFCIDLIEIRDKLQKISLPVLKALEEHWGEIRTEIERELIERS